MKVQEVILRAVVGHLKRHQAAEILGISDRQMRRRKQRYEQGGYDGLFDRRRRGGSVDGQTWRPYGENLEANLQELSGIEGFRIKSSLISSILKF